MNGGLSAKNGVKLDLEGKPDMKKWLFWCVMCLASLLNGASFFKASLHAMRRGLDGTDNQAALIFVPFLWFLAIFVLVLINGYTLMRGIKIEREQTICLMDIFRLSGLSKRAKAGRILFMIATAILMLFGYSLFAAEIMWAASYALSGGALLLFLYAWARTAAQAN